MAANGAQDVFTPENVLQAMLAMRGQDRDKKVFAMDYLDKFQKSKDAWNVTIGILQSSTDGEALSFAAITLKGKITYDLSTQVTESDLPALRSQLLVLLKKFSPGPRPVRVQLCVCLAILAIHMTSWHDVLNSVVVSLGDSVESHACILDFLKVLPEEVTEGRKITLSEEELTQRTTELLADNAQRVVELLINYAQSSESAARNPQLMECITSWLREVPVNFIVKTPLLNVVINALGHDDSLQQAAECLGVICYETRDVDDNVETIQILLPKIVQLRPLIRKAMDEDDTEAFRALTRLFAEAGDSWVVAIAREPGHFRPLVDTILECCVGDKERDVISYTFNFWFELKQYIVLERYATARKNLGEVYLKLVDILMKHLEYPQSDNGNELDLFDGDRELEEKFREFRHRMGDTLKDACEVLGVTTCLTKVLDAMKLWMQKYGAQATTPTSVPHWQELEGPLFSMRAMGRMVPKEEDTVLPQLMPLLVQMPAHEKLRFATIMVFGRYTEWTAEHPEFLQPQFNYIVSSFQTDSKEIIRAAAQSIKYFCTDCKHLLSDQVLQLQTFYDQILDKLPELSQEEMTEGVASVVAVQKTEDIYSLLKLCCDPLFSRLMVKADNATTEVGKLALADHLQLITVFVQTVKPYTEEGQENPAVKYWQEVFPVLSKVLDNFLDFTPICERVCRCWRFMVISYRTAMTPILKPMAEKLAHGFQVSKQGCFLWVTGAILREFSEEREHVSDSISEGIYSFFETQATTVLRVLHGLPASEAPDVIEDYFRLLIDALLFYHQKLIPSPLLTPIFEAAITALTLQQRDPLSATLHFLRDLLTYGGDNPVGFMVPPSDPSLRQLQQVVRRLLATHGELLVKQVLNGMLNTFPRDCFADGSGVLLAMLEHLPAETTGWIERAIQTLPPGSVSPAESSRLMLKIKEKLEAGEQGQVRQVRALLQDFTNTYRRRNVQQRDGLGQLDASVFHFEG